jgi:hypothetical protein
MKYIILCACLVGCAGAADTGMTRTASALEAEKDVFRSFCVPAPVGKEKICDTLKAVINTEISTYTVANEALK